MSLLLRGRAKIQEAVETVTHRLAWTIVGMIRNEIRFYAGHGEKAFWGNEMADRVNDFERELNRIVREAAPQLFVK